MKNLPLNRVYIGDHGKLAVVKECTVCGEEHRHGAADERLLEGGRSRRVAHCPTYRGEYLLKLAEDADPPECATSGRGAT